MIYAILVCVFLVIYVSLCGIAIKLYNMAWECFGTRLTPLFIVRGNKIFQVRTKAGKAMLMARQRAMKDKRIPVRLFLIAKFFNEQLNEILLKLKPNKVYKTKTHILRAFEKASRKGQLTIISAKKANKRYLIETLPFLGFKEYVSLRYGKNKEYRNSILKQFYIITFTRN